MNLIVAESQVPPAKQARHLELLEKNSAGTITQAERAELAALREQADQLMLRKAYAWALLRWRGYPLPATEFMATLPEPVRQQVFVRANHRCEYAIESRSLWVLYGWHPPKD